MIVLNRLQDPGNLGTILRTAEGAGVTGILLDQECVDIYNPKTIRSTMGSIYRMPFYYSQDLKKDIGCLKLKGSASTPRISMAGRIMTRLIIRSLARF